MTRGDGVYKCDTPEEMIEISEPSPPVKSVYQESFDDMTSAARLEAQLKK